MGQATFLSESVQMKKQVEKSHYSFSRYLGKRRWVSFWHQFDEVLNYHPECVLEIGPGPGIFKSVAMNIGLHVETLDLDPELVPDHVASVLELPFANDGFDVVCAFQMLEHIQFDLSIKAFREMCRVASKAVVISLPDAARCWQYSFYLPKIGNVRFLVPKPRLSLPVHEFDGEHYWEINKAGYSLKKVINKFSECEGVRLTKTYRVHENPYHRFFVFEKTLPAFVGNCDVN